MDRPVRIAVVGDVDERLVGELRQLPLAPEVRPMSSVVGDTESLMRFQPDVLLARPGDDPSEDVGAVKLLQRLWPALAVGVLTDERGEVALAPVAKRLSAALIVHPGPAGQLAAAVEQLLHGGDRPRPELFVDLAHGLADEINNPLMFVSGHLQLLQAQLSASGDEDRGGQVQAALQGLTRIQAAVDRLRLLSEAADGPRHREQVDLAALLSRAVAARTPDMPNATVEMPEGAQVVDGDREQLALAVTAIVEFADEVAAIAAHSHLELEATDGALRVRLLVGGQGLDLLRRRHEGEPGDLGNAGREGDPRRDAEPVPPGSRWPRSVAAGHHLAEGSAQLPQARELDL